MRAELVVESQMRAFAEQIEVEIATGSAESGRGLRARPRCRRSARAADSAVEPFGSAPANRPASWMRDSSLPCRRARRSPRPRCASGRKARTTRLVVLDVQAEIVERVGVAALDDRVGFGGQFGHDGTHVGCCDEDAQRPVERHAQPVRPVRQFVFDLVEGFLEQEEIEQSARLPAGSAGHSRWIGHGLAVGGPGMPRSALSRQSSSAGASLPCSSGATLSARSSAAVAE